jgi:hypothetical protein
VCWVAARRRGRGQTQAPVCRSQAGRAAGLDSAWMRFFPGLDLSSRFSPLFTKPLRTFGFSDYEVRVTVPPPAWPKQIKDRLGPKWQNAGVLLERDPWAASSCFSSSSSSSSQLPAQTSSNQLGQRPDGEVRSVCGRFVARQHAICGRKQAVFSLYVVFIYHRS